MFDAIERNRMSRLRGYDILLRRFVKARRSGLATPTEAEISAECSAISAERDGPHWDADTLESMAGESELRSLSRGCEELIAELQGILEQYANDDSIEEYVQPFVNQKRALRQNQIQAQEVMRSRGLLVDPVSPVDQAVAHVVNRIKSRAQVQIELRKACEEMKSRAPQELHSDIERSFRMAIDANNKE